MQQQTLEQQRDVWMTPEKAWRRLGLGSRAYIDLGCKHGSLTCKGKGQNLRVTQASIEALRDVRAWKDAINAFDQARRAERRRAKEERERADRLRAEEAEREKREREQASVDGVSVAGDPAEYHPEDQLDTAETFVQRVRHIEFMLERFCAELGITFDTMHDNEPKAPV